MRLCGFCPMRALHLLGENEHVAAHLLVSLVSLQWI